MLIGDFFGDPAFRRRALSDVDVLFLVTFSDWEHLQEAVVGKQIVHDAHQAGVKHLAFSGGMRTSEAILDFKADIEDEIRAHTWSSLSVWHSGFFYENFVFKDGQQRFECSLQPESKSDNKEQRKVLALKFQSPMPSSHIMVLHAASDVGYAAAAHILDVVRGNSLQMWSPEQPACRLVGQQLSGNKFALAVADVFWERHVTCDATYHSFDVRMIRDSVPGICISTYRNASFVLAVADDATLCTSADCRAAAANVRLCAGWRHGCA